MSDKEIMASIPNMSDEKLIELLRDCGRDPYYDSFWNKAIEEIERRLKEANTTA